jgi:hypothetical protein
VGVADVEQLHCHLVNDVESFLGHRCVFQRFAVIRERFVGGLKRRLAQFGRAADAVFIAHF